ncbi:hypothetical protein VV089_17735 [Candidatus Merdisoma sp. JLR.KK011]|uniref:hypothetical protein n=1 Tax=Candidatus Merdisoma sp. JLR.KK011 TaxID=3114299 RepID=UPI002FF2F56B
MKKIFPLLILIICISFAIRYTMHGVREEKDSFYLMGSGKKIITEMQETLREKKETEEIQKTSSENEETLDIIIKNLLAQIDANLVEGCLGLWNGYSQEIRLMYKMKSNKGNTNYYMTEIGLDGSVRGYINEATKDVYERFKQISIKMS